jgi:hypothetical protein
VRTASEAALDVLALTTLSFLVEFGRGVEQSLDLIPLKCPVRSRPSGPPLVVTARDRPCHGSLFHESK